MEHDYRRKARLWMRHLVYLNLLLSMFYLFSCFVILWTGIDWSETYCCLSVCMQTLTLSVTLAVTSFGVKYVFPQVWPLQLKHINMSTLPQWSWPLDLHVHLETLTCRWCILNYNFKDIIQLSEIVCHGEHAASQMQLWETIFLLNYQQNFYKCTFSRR